MTRIDELHLAITISNQWQVKNEIFNEGLGIHHLIENLDKFEDAIHRLSYRESFTEDEANERCSNAISDREEIAYDQRLYQQECEDHNY